MPEVCDIISHFIRYVACMWCKYAADMETALFAPKRGSVLTFCWDTLAFSLPRVYYVQCSAVKMSKFIQEDLE